jgi:integrase
MPRPKSDADGIVLNILRGAKNGRVRMVPVRTEYQADVLSRATRMAGNGSMMPAEYSLAQWENHYNWVMHREKVTRKGLGITSHGLRHEYVHGRYEEKLGVAAPVKGGGKPGMDAADANAQKRMISEELGHSRPQIIGCYSGSPKTAAKKRAAPGMPVPDGDGGEAERHGLAASAMETEDA